LRIHEYTYDVVIFAISLFITIRGPNTKIHEIRPFNAGIPGIVAFG